MVMKKILFTIGRLDNGGVAKSLLSLLSVIDKQKYDISLLVVGSNHGHLSEVPKGVKIYTDPVLSYVDAGVAGLILLLKRGRLFLMLGSILRLVVSQLNRGWGGLLLSKLMPVITEEYYDLIVDYNGQQMLYYMVDKLNGKKKISFFHNDYKKWAYYQSVDKRYYPKVDAVFTISPLCVQSMKDVFPEISHKVYLMENISNVSQIREKANERIDFKRSHQYMIISVGHITKRKGSDIALNVARKLKETGFDFEWLFIGEVHNDYNYEEFINENHLSGHVKMLGPINNPYPYVKEADIFVQLSRFEGKSLSLDEAKILEKPIVVTNFSSVNDQFTNGVNASICQMDADDAYLKIRELLENEALRQRYRDSLGKSIADNSSEVEKIYKLIEA